MAYRVWQIAGDVKREEKERPEAPITPPCHAERVDGLGSVKVLLPALAGLRPSQRRSISPSDISRQQPDGANAGLTLPLDIAAQIVDHARRGFPEEVCGLVAGRGGTATAVFPGRNISPSPLTAYELDHETLARIIEMEDAGLDLVAIYHSHPLGPENPSETDIAGATYPDTVYLIVSLAKPNRPAIRGFRIMEGTAREIKVTGFSLT